MLAIVTTIILFYIIHRSLSKTKEELLTVDEKKMMNLLLQYNLTSAKLIELFVPKDVRDEIYIPIFESIQKFTLQREIKK